MDASRELQYAKRRPKWRENPAHIDRAARASSLESGDPLARSRSARGAARAFAISGLVAFLTRVPLAAQAEEPAEAGPRALLSELSWRAIGPAVFSGRITDLELLPGAPHGFLVASASGGLWRTRNNGTTFDCIFQREGTISIGDVAVDPLDADVIWVGTGEANNQRSSYWGDGVYKTTDGGESWKNVGLADSHHVGRIAIDPRDGKVAYVAALGHLYTPNEERGLFKTKDGGEDWERVLFVSPEVGIVDVALDPANPDRIYAASYERLRRPWHFDGAGPGAGIWRSDDAGATWKRLAGGLPEGEIDRIGLAVHAGDPRTVFATVSNANPLPPEPGAPAELLGFTFEHEEGGLRVEEVDEDGPAVEAGIVRGDLVTAIESVVPSNPWTLFEALGRKGYGDEITLEFERDGAEQRASFVLAPPAARGERTVGGEIWRSDDHGETWRKVNEEEVGGDPPYYYGQIRVDPRDAQRLYLLGVPAYQSEDGGESWDADLAPGLHVDHHALVIDPAIPERLILGNDGGLSQSYDRGKNWDHYPNLPLAQFYAVGVDMRRPYHVYGGTQDNGTWGGPSRSRDRGGIAAGEWYRVGGGDGFYAQIDPRDPDTVYAESQFGALFRRDLATGETKSIRPPRSEPRGARDRYNWNAPILISHHNPEILYFGGNKLFKSFDRGDHWPIVSPDLTTADALKIEGNVPHCTLTTIAESPLDPSLLLVGSDDGLVQRSTDGGLSWTNLTGRFPGAPGGWWVSRVELSRHAAGGAYVSFNGYREDDFRPFVYASDDRGESWRSIAEGLPPGPVNVVREDPHNARVLYVGTDFGVFVSIDAGASWERLAKELPTIAVHDLIVHPRDRELVIATHGRGFWIADVAALAELDAEALAAPAHLCPVVDQLLLGSASTDESQGQRVWRGTNPERGTPIWYHLRDPQEKGALELTVLDVAGREVAKLDVVLEAGLHVAQWDQRARTSVPASEGRRRRTRTARAQPGSYTAVLVLGEERFERTFELIADPRAESDP